MKKYKRIRNPTELPFTSPERIEHELLSPARVVVRCYVLEAWDIPSKGSDKPTTYAKLLLGKRKLSSEDNKQKKTTNPRFYKMFEFAKTKIPGTSVLHVQVYQYNRFSSDELIGETKIDLEDRFYSQNWRNLKDCPIEVRGLFHPSSAIEQGRIGLWLDIIPAENSVKLAQKWDINPKPPVEYEARMIIWETEDVPRVDAEDCVDIFVTANLATGKKLSTDVHYRS